MIVNKWGEASKDVVQVEVGRLQWSHTYLLNPGGVRTCWPCDSLLYILCPKTFK